MRLSHVTLGISTAAILISAGWFTLRALPEKSTSITLTFHAEMGGAPLVYDQFVYDNPGGPGTFRVRDFRFYLSNLSVAKGAETYSEADSYHLLRFDNADRSHSITLTDVPLQSVETVGFLIGVDPEANSSIQPRGDLDPNSQMAWNWEVGYKFVVFEGALRIGETVSPVVYHVGFSENARQQSFAIPSDSQVDGDVQVDLTVDLAKLFNGATRIDMETLPSVKFDRTDAKDLADNYADMIAPKF
ncbi:MbnP family protein [Ruegeria halocynthiae]|uniref:MbnP family protein n=1 Tax=Ruegeria halocynthiae TaxID=985054 RepID=UPI000569B6E5|nr:MbnP family protein [Ruegeria halocynthiae]